jgi:hypothetical protein
MTAKRAIWIIRAILYPSLALAAVFLLTHRGAEADAGPITLYAQTSQGHYFSAGVRDGRVFRIGTRLDVSCPDHAFVATESLDDDAIDDDGERVSVERLTFHLQARRDGAGLTGTMEAAGDECGSGTVTFSAHE